MEAKHSTKPTPVIPPQVEVKASPIHGYGVFATQDFAVAEQIEDAPALFFESTIKFPQIVYDRVFYAGNDWSCLPLGYGAVYNHADECNARYEFDRQYNLFKVIATKPIKQGEEIFINYGNMYFRIRAGAGSFLIKFKKREKLRQFFRLFLVATFLLAVAYISRT